MRDHKTFPAGVRRESVAQEIETFLFAYAPDLIVVSTSAGSQAKSMVRFLEDMTQGLQRVRQKQRESYAAHDDLDDDDLDELEDPAEVLHCVDTLGEWQREKEERNTDVKEKRSGVGGGTGVLIPNAENRPGCSVFLVTACVPASAAATRWA